MEISTLDIRWILPPQLAIVVVASITHDNGFHINPKNLSILLSFKANNS
jgi:hypothetical protein